MKTPLKILMLEDLEDDAGLIKGALKKGGVSFEAIRVDSKEAFMKTLHQFKPDVILSDHSLPQFNSVEALKLCRQHDPYMPFILVTGTVSEEFAVECIKDGADDYILKTNLARLTAAVKGAIEKHKTEKKKLRAEKALRNQNLELLKLNEELDKFVYSVSHDLRAPLKSVLGLINLAEVESKTSNSLEEYFERMKQSVDKLDNTLNEILDYSRNSRSKMELTRISLKGLVEECFEKVRYMDGFDQIDRQVTIDGNDKVYTDVKRLAIIFNNLISNAIKYRDPAKNKNVINIWINVNKFEIVISFKDNGIGIPPRHVDNVCDMFYRATDRSDGAGLGLYIVKETVQKLKGKITISSKEGEGTEFFIQVPNFTKPMTDLKNSKPAVKGVKEKNNS